MKDLLLRYMPPDYSLHGRSIDDLIFMVHVLMAILFIGWGFYFIYVLYRFNEKRTPRADYVGARTHASTYIEAGVAAIEVILLVAISIPAWYSWATPPDKSKNPLELRVVAEQFAWNVHYPGADGKFGRSDMKLVTASNPLGLDPNDADGKDDIVTLNQLHLEVNRPALIHVSSKDVIHSFKLPVMRAEQDAIPGMSVSIHFTPIKVSGPDDHWEIACAQLCGLGHYRMRGQMAVHTKDDFQKWLKENAPAAPPAEAPAPPANPVPEANPAQPATNTAQPATTSG
jgi:cytochrome c oxidase subunit 2